MKFIPVSKCTRSAKPYLHVCLDIFKTKRRSKQDYVSASHTFNYMINDTLVDWLKLTSKKGNKQSCIFPKSESFNEFILSRGVEFEKECVKYINNHKVPVIKVSEFITDESCKKTIELMKKGVPVLHSVPVRNKINGTQGIIDLLIRSDYLGKIVDLNPLNEKEIVIPSPLLSLPFHYVVVDIKFSTLPLRADGIHLLNSGNYPSYKAQCLIYTEAIGLIQGYTSQYAFIMGRRWKYTSMHNTFKNYTFLNRLGKIDFTTVDSDYKQHTQKAIDWVRDVRKNASKWSVNPPSRIELYPNMCVDSGIWNYEKEQIATSIQELTSLWHVSYKHRNIAISKGVSRWNDPRCNTKTMEINGTRAKTIDKIIDINRQTKDAILPRKIVSNIYNWKTSNMNDLYIDFETLSDIFADFNQLPEQPSTNIIFMIGVGWYDGESWHYTNFICNKLTQQEEHRIMTEFIMFVNSRNKPNLYYWYAEQQMWNTAIQRHTRILSLNGSWCDLSTLFRTEPIVIKGCFKFGLKEVAKAMRYHGMISTKIESECDSGTSAMILSWKCYNKDPNPASSCIMHDISKYNQFDCKVLWEILVYLRKNHL